MSTVRANRAVTLIELLVVVTIIGVLATVVSMLWTPTFGIWQRLDVAAAPFRLAHARALFGDTTYFVIIDQGQNTLTVKHAGGQPVLDPKTGNPYQLQLESALSLEILSVAPPTDTAFFSNGGGLNRDVTLTVAPAGYPGQRYTIDLRAPHCRVQFGSLP